MNKKCWLKSEILNYKPQMLLLNYNTEKEFQKEMLNVSQDCWKNGKTLLSTFPIVIKYLDKGSLMGKGMILPHNSRVQSITVENQGNRSLNQMITLKRQSGRREQWALCLPHALICTVQDPSPGKRVTFRGQVILLTKPRQLLTGLFRALSLKWF